MRWLIFILLLPPSALADANVTSFGAVGDTKQTVLNTTSGSATISCGTNVFASGDVGKIIQMFQAGAATSGGYHQDLVAVIKTFNSATQVVLDRNCGNSSNGVVAWFGTDCRPGFQACVDASSGVLTIPAGRYMLVSPQATNASFTMVNDAEVYPAVYLSKGGITWAGAGSSTILHGCGAWQLKGSYVYRGAMFFAESVTNNGALVFQDLEMYGGVITGRTDQIFFPASTTTGDWWDLTHDALIDGLNTPNFLLKRFTNVYFHNWRGETVKSITDTGGTNTFIEVLNCTFFGGNASALNFTFGQRISGCTFSNYFLILEHFQDYSRSNCYFVNNTVGDISAGNINIVGAVTNRNPYPWLFSGNTFYGQLGVGIFVLGNSQNITITSNSFFNAGGGVSFTGAGVQPANGTATVISNVVVAFNALGNTFTPISMDGYPTTAVRIFNNTCNIASQFASGGGSKSNVVFFGNINSGAGTFMDYTTVTDGSFPLDTANTYTLYNNASASNVITYARGSQQLANNSGGQFYFVRTNLNPFGARLRLTNATAGVALTLNTAPLVSIPAGSDMTFYWYSPNWYTQQMSYVQGNLNILRDLILGQ